MAIINIMWFVPLLSIIGITEFLFRLVYDDNAKSALLIIFSILFLNFGLSGITFMQPENKIINSNKEYKIIGDVAILSKGDESQIFYAIPTEKKVFSIKAENIKKIVENPKYVTIEDVTYTQRFGPFYARRNVQEAKLK